MEPENGKKKYKHTSTNSAKIRKKKSAKQLKGEKMNENKSWKKFHFFKKKSAIILIIHPVILSGV